MRKTFTLVLLVIVVLFAFCLTAFAVPYEFSNTIPTFGHKTLTSSTRATSQNSWTFCMKTSSQAACATCWVDYENGAGTNIWYPATNNVTVYNTGKTNSYIWGRHLPSLGTRVRLRTEGSLVYGGQTIVGIIDFK